MNPLGENIRPTNEQNFTTKPKDIEEKKSESVISNIAKETIEPKSEKENRSLKSKFKATKVPSESDLRSNIETRKLRKIKSLSMMKTGDIPSEKTSSTLNLKPFQLGASSNPVAVLRHEYFMPLSFIELLMKENSEELESTSQLYNKEAFISNLYIEFQRLPDDSSQKEALRVIIKELTGLQESYLNEETISSYINKLRNENISGNLRRNLIPYIKLNNLSPRASAIAKQAIKKDLERPIHERLIEFPPEVAVYKGGTENLREILATKKAQIMGYGDVLHLKEPVLTENFKLTWIDTPVVHPIKSSFLEGYRHIDSSDWSNWGEARKESDLEMFQTGRVSEQTAEKMKKAEQTILDYDADPASVCKLCFYELAVSANDFHFNQFMIGLDPQTGKKRVVSVDEGRWGLEDIAYPYMGSIAVTFKNCLITHPDCLKPVPEEFRNFLKERLNNIDKTTKELVDENLINSINNFKELENNYRELIDFMSTLSRIGKIKESDMPNVIKTMEDKYGFFLNTSGLTIDQIKKQFVEFLRMKKIKMKEASFVKQSEQSLTKEVEREKKMAEYIISNPKATLYEAFEIGYPQLKTFMKVLRRTENDPGAYIGYVKGQYARNLKSFIQTAQRQNLASDDEIKQMESDYNDLFNNHKISNESIALTTDAF